MARNQWQLNKRPSSGDGLVIMQHGGQIQHILLFSPRPVLLADAHKTTRNVVLAPTLLMHFKRSLTNSPLSSKAPASQKKRILRSAHETRKTKAREEWWEQLFRMRLAGLESFSRTRGRERERESSTFRNFMRKRGSE